MINPQEALIDGIEVIEPILKPYGFQFRYGGHGASSGGAFAWGEFIRDERRLELHFRNSLGMVRYHIRDQSASHESYMREMGVWQRCRYPGFSKDTSAVFRALAHDLNFAEDFTSGDASVLLRAAAKEFAISKEQELQLIAGAVGDIQKLEEMKTRFHEKRYEEVIRLAEDLRYPSEMSPSERRLVQLAKSRVKPSRTAEH